MQECDKNNLSLEELTAYCKKKGFVYRSSEIYGGVTGVFDYGHIGTLLKRNVEKMWKGYFSRLHENFFEIDTGLIMHENVFKASGHLENFFDPIVVIEGSDETFRADHLIEEKSGERAEGLSIEEMQERICSQKLLGDDVEYSKVSVTKLNMMFDVKMGPKKGTIAYLRPETAQSPYVNFKSQFELQRKKLPMGLLLIGRVFRNEISPRNMLLRTREVEQMELQIFFNPNTLHNRPQGFDEVSNVELPVVCVGKSEIEMKTPQELIEHGIPEMYVYYMARVFLFYRDELCLAHRFRFLELDENERAFYNKNHFDMEILMYSTNKWVEVGGVHYRTNHDLSGHQRVSKVSMEVQDESRQEKVVPHVLELSFGLGRTIYALLDTNLRLNDDRGNSLYQFPIRLSPIPVAILPLMNKPELVECSRRIEQELQDEEVMCVFDKSGSIGKRYARYDEIGTYFCVTIDYESLEDNCVTFRNRDTTEQKRVSIEGIGAYCRGLVLGREKF